MSTPPSTPSDDFQTVLDQLGLDEARRGLPGDVTFVPTRSDDQPVLDPSLASLPKLTVVQGLERLPLAADLALESLIGEGGRGEVRRAQQLPLRRDVAVKTLKGEPTPALVRELLREARITGGLEHPNIVPVYTLGRDEQGRVMLVMRRLSGEPWRHLLRDEAPGRTEVQIERHLEIFGQVCRAVEYAHQQGIVHRDLKPDNVFVGSFGEVVVLDWGLALSLEGDAARDLPPAREARGLAGTPAYMAPELVGGRGADVGRWTDVYLLGAILHEVFTGHPPHRGAALPQVLEAAYRSPPPTYGPEVPAEIGEVCRRAMAREPADRFGSVAALREAVHDVSRHRQSLQLAEEARQRLATPGRSALAQARFGFEQSLRGWSGNPAARAGLETALEAEFEMDVAEHNLAGAERVLAQLAAPRPALTARVEALRQAEARRAAELERLRLAEQERAPEVSERLRNRWFVFLAAAWFVVPMGVDLGVRAGWLTLGPKPTLTGVAIFAVLTGVASWFSRAEVLRNQMGRRLLGCFLVLMGLLVVLRLTHGLLGLPRTLVMMPEMLLYAQAGAMFTILVDGRFILPAVVYTLGSVAIGFWPESALRIVAIANLVGTLPMALFWTSLEGWPRRRPPSAGHP